MPIYLHFSQSTDLTALADRRGEPDEIALKGDQYRIAYHTGHVLTRYEVNGYDDSDFYAVVYNPNTNALEHVFYATTRCYTYNDSAVVDATPEVIEQARAVLRTVVEQHIRKADHLDTLKLKVGRVVRFVKAYRPRSSTRPPIEVGQIAYLDWIGPDSYAPHTDRARVRLVLGENDHAEVYINANKLEVYSPETYLPGDDDVQERVDRFMAIQPTQWRFRG